MTVVNFDDETFERELFARRAAVVPAPALDFDDVVARASRSPERAAAFGSAAWITMAAALFVVVRASSFALPAEEIDHAIASEMETGVCKGPALEEPSAGRDESACVDPSKMICEVTFGACRP